MEGVRTPLATVFKLYRNESLHFLHIPTDRFPRMAPKSLWDALMGNPFQHTGGVDDSLLSH